MCDGKNECPSYGFLPTSDITPIFDSRQADELEFVCSTREERLEWYGFTDISPYARSALPVDGFLHPGEYLKCLQTVSKLDTFLR